jgi:NAD(P)-dependent dehydrogenase (short-subunit alcohol dehydrogenase family)
MISSATATIMLENHAAYMGTKAGTDHVVRCVANEFGQFGIRANSISPGRGVLAAMGSSGGRGHVQAIQLSELSKLSERKWHEQLHINIA